MYDAIVIGARCAGASTALLLARRGHRVLIVDRARVPSDLAHGHFIHRHGPRRLHRWGLLDRVAATNCPAVTSMTVDEGDFALTGRDLEVDGVALGYGPRRSALDRVLVEAAVEAGAELRDAYTVDDLLWDGDAVVGIRGHARHSLVVGTERARLVVGADGRHSRIARAVGAPAYEVEPSLTGWYWSYWGDLPVDGLSVHVRDERVIMAFPTNDALTAVFVAWPTPRLEEVRADVERAFHAAVDLVPSLGPRLRDARREDRFLVALDLPNFLRVPHGPGWALVGDAGCHKDPFLALGICDALRDAELLADATHAGLAGDAPLADALAGFARARDAATLADYRENLVRAQFAPPPPHVMQLRAALRDDPAATNRFFLAYEGMVPRETFFDQENIQTIVAGAASRRPAMR